jgi:hypothetical protein
MTILLHVILIVLLVAISFWSTGNYIYAGYLTGQMDGYNVKKLAKDAIVLKKDLKKDKFRSNWSFRIGIILQILSFVLFYLIIK